LPPTFRVGVSVLDPWGQWAISCDPREDAGGAWVGSRLIGWDTTGLLLGPLVVSGDCPIPGGRSGVDGLAVGDGELADAWPMPGGSLGLVLGWNWGWGLKLGMGVLALLWVPLGESLAPLLLPFPLLAMLLVGWLWLQGTTQQQKGASEAMYYREGWECMYGVVGNRDG
jgi:hypothetical protein